MGLYTTAIVTAFVAFTASCYQDRPAPGGPRPHGMRPPGQTYEADGAKGMPDMRGFQQGAPSSGSAPGGWSKKGAKGSRPEPSGSTGSGNADGMPGMDSFDKGMAEMLSGMSMEDMMGKPDAQDAGGAGSAGTGGGTPGAGPYDGLSAEEIMGTVPESEFPEKFKKLQEDRLRQEKDGFETKDDPRPDSTVRASTENVDVHITEQVRRPVNPGPPKRQSDGEFAETAADMEDDGHLADYAYVSRITFKSPAHATRALEDINKGSIEFLELAMAQRMGSGGGGLTQGGGEVIDIVCRKDVEAEYTTVVFDVREQLSSLGQKPTVHGPVCSAQGNCALIAVFSRYRRQFFSQAWREFENFALKNNMPFSEMVDIIRSDEISLRELAYMVWDGEHRSIKQANVKQLKKDLDLIGKNEDPTTQRMAPPARPRDFRRHEQLMIAREKTLSMVPDAVKEDHPEIWGMSIEQIHEKGWVEVPVKTPTKPAAEDEVSPKSDGQTAGDQNTSGSENDDGLNKRLRLRAMDPQMPRVSAGISSPPAQRMQVAADALARSGGQSSAWPSSPSSSALPASAKSGNNTDDYVPSDPSYLRRGVTSPNPRSGTSPLRGSLSAAVAMATTHHRGRGMSDGELRPASRSPPRPVSPHTTTRRRANSASATGINTASATIDVVSYDRHEADQPRVSPPREASPTTWYFGFPGGPRGAPAETNRPDDDVQAYVQARRAPRQRQTPVQEEAVDQHDEDDGSGAQQSTYGQRVASFDPHRRGDRQLSPGSSYNRHGTQHTGDGDEHDSALPQEAPDHQLRETSREQALDCVLCAAHEQANRAESPYRTAPPTPSVKISPPRYPLAATTTSTADERGLQHSQAPVPSTLDALFGTDGGTTATSTARRRPGRRSDPSSPSPRLREALRQREERRRSAPHQSGTAPQSAPQRTGPVSPSTSSTQRKSSPVRRTTSPRQSPRSPMRVTSTGASPRTVGNADRDTSALVAAAASAAASAAVAAFQKNRSAVAVVDHETAESQRAALVLREVDRMLASTEPHQSQYAARSSPSKHRSASRNKPAVMLSPAAHHMSGSTNVEELDREKKKAAQAIAQVQETAHQEKLHLLQQLTEAREEITELKEHRDRQQRLLMDAEQRCRDSERQSQDLQQLVMALRRELKACEADEAARAMEEEARRLLMEQNRGMEQQLRDLRTTIARLMESNDRHAAMDAVERHRAALATPR